MLKKLCTGPAKINTLPKASLSNGHKKHVVLSFHFISFHLLIIFIITFNNHH